MKLSDLYNLCDNLDGSTEFWVYNVLVPSPVDHGDYLDIAIRWHDPEIKGFKLTDTGCNIYI